MPENLDYQPRISEPAEGKSIYPALTVVVLTILINILLLATAWKDQSWGAMFIQFVAAPAANALLILVTLLHIPLLKLRKYCDVGTYVRTSVLLPAAAVVVDFLIIMQMPLHGC